MPAPSGAESAAWVRAKSQGTPAAYLAFYSSYPNSKRLTVLRADVHPVLSLGSNFLSSSNQGGAVITVINPTAELLTITIEVRGHPELSGEYDQKTAAALEFAKANAEGEILPEKKPLKNVRLFIAQVDGRPRVVATRQ